MIGIPTFVPEDQFRIKGRGKILTFRLSQNKQMEGISVGDVVKAREAYWTVSGIERFSNLHGPCDQVGLVVRPATEREVKIKNV